MAYLVRRQLVRLGVARWSTLLRGADNALYHISYASAWSGWESLGGVLSSGPDASSWGSGRLDVFARGTDNTLYHQSYSGGWSGWEGLGAPGAPSNLLATTYRGKTTVDFRWGGTGGASMVHVLRAGAPSGPFSDVTEVGALKDWARTTQGVVGVTQYFKIAAVYGTGVVESAPLAVTIALPPQGVINLRATSPGPGIAELQWACDPEAIGYSLLRGKGSEPLEWIKSPGSTIPLKLGKWECQYKDTSLWNGATYRYRVSASYPDPNTSAGGSVSVVIGQ